MPLTVFLVGHGGREYYGGTDFTPEKLKLNSLNWKMAIVTCNGTNSTGVVFYTCTGHPSLTMEVIPVGKVTSGLSMSDTLGSRETITFSLTESKERMEGKL